MLNFGWTVAIAQWIMSETSTCLPLIYIQMSHTQEIGFHVISQRVFYVNIATSGLEVIPHFVETSEKGTSTTQSTSRN